MSRLTCLLALFFFSVASSHSHAFEASLQPEALCQWTAHPVEITSAPPPLGAVKEWIAEPDKHIKITFRPRFENWRLATISVSSLSLEPQMQFRIAPPCTVIEGRQLIYKAGRVDEIAVLDSQLNLKSREPQNPKFIAPTHLANPSVPPLLALVDTGVNYLLPAFQNNLARTEKGQLIGYDFWDDDPFPFDKDPRHNPFYPLHHGSTVFSVLSAEAPALPAAIYRFPADDLCKFTPLIEHAATQGIRIINMSMGSKQIEDWRCFYEAAQRHPHILFIVSAGNDALNIDTSPVYPAALDLENMLVATSADIFGRLGPAANFGIDTVDVMVPAEQMDVIDHRGVRTTTGGSSYAAPRLAALAARFLADNPDASTSQIMAFIQSRAISSVQQVTRFGWIPDPSDDHGF